jgi:3',5'-cyclic AMP phosphodiesterase CpdA
MEKVFTFAQITDLHAGRTIRFPSGTVDLHRELLRTVDTLKSLEPLPDLLVVSGDLSNHGGKDDYLRVKEALDTLPMPYFIVVGNHDSRSLLRSMFPGHCGPGSREPYIQYCIEDFPLRIIILDTLAVGSHRGLIDAERIGWLEERLSEQPRRPTAIFMHHPPFKTGMPYPDSLGLDGTAELGNVVASFPNIEAVISGHTHRDSTRRWNGTVAYVTASSAFSYKLEFNDVDDLDPLFTPPVFRIFRWDPDTGLVSHLCFAGNYEYGLSEGVPEAPDN